MKKVSHAPCCSMFVSPSCRSGLLCVEQKTALFVEAMLPPLADMRSALHASCPTLSLFKLRAFGIKRQAQAKCSAARSLTFSSTQHSTWWLLNSDPRDRQNVSYLSRLYCPYIASSFSPLSAVTSRYLRLKDSLPSALPLLSAPQHPSFSPALGTLLLLYTLLAS